MENNAERTLTLGDFWKVFKRAFLLMVIAAVLFSAAHAAYKYVTYKPIYVSDGMINTMRKNATSTSNNTASHPGNEVEYAIFVQTQCVELMKTRKVYEAVINEFENFNVGWETLASIITVKPIENTALISVSVRAGNPKSAQLILEKYMDKSIELLSDEQYDLLGNAQSMGSIIDGASLPSAPANSRFSLLSVIVGFVAAVLVYAIFLVRYMINDYITDPRDIAELTGLPLLAKIPDSKASSDQKRKSRKEKKSHG